MMKEILKASLDPDGGIKAEEDESAASWTRYLPVLVIVGLALAAAASWSLRDNRWSLSLLMTNFMGLYLIFFSMVKLFDLPGFVQSFAKYDLLAGRSRVYGFSYPFLELALGLAFLADLAPVIVLSLTVPLFLFGFLGVHLALRRDEDLDCACMGSVLSVPLSTVAVIENLGMVAMATWMLVVRL